LRQRTLRIAGFLAEVYRIAVASLDFII
jgi:hypothetical protein